MDDDEIHEAKGAMIHRGRVEAGIAGDWVGVSQAELDELRKERDALTMECTIVRKSFVRATEKYDLAMDEIDRLQTVIAELQGSLELARRQREQASNDANKAERELAAMIKRVKHD